MHIQELDLYRKGCPRNCIEITEAIVGGRGKKWKLTTMLTRESDNADRMPHWLQVKVMYK